VVVDAHDPRSNPMDSDLVVFERIVSLLLQMATLTLLPLELERVLEVRVIFIHHTGPPLLRLVFKNPVLVFGLIL